LVLDHLDLLGALVHLMRDASNSIYIGDKPLCSGALREAGGAEGNAESENVSSHESPFVSEVWMQESGLPESG
jgi:hypothetical protein